MTDPTRSPRALKGAVGTDHGVVPRRPDDRWSRHDVRGRQAAIRALAGRRPSAYVTASAVSTALRTRPTIAPSQCWTSPATAPIRLTTPTATTAGVAHAAE